MTPRFDPIPIRKMRPACFTQGAFFLQKFQQKGLQSTSKPKPRGPNALRQYRTMRQEQIPRKSEF